MLVNITYRDCEEHVVSFVDAMLRRIMQKATRREDSKTLSDGTTYRQINYFATVKPLEDFGADEAERIEL